MNAFNVQKLEISTSQVSATTKALMGALLLGVVMVFATGFSSTSAVHNAAHDMRHTNAFPCH